MNQTPVQPSSPHPRGCSALAASDSYLRKVVPAPAGVFPWCSSRRAPGPCRPRTRGGVPTNVRPTRGDAESSPHPRGCSRSARARRSARHVVPAPAGVFPRGRSLHGGQRRRPRTRGGVPRYDTSASGTPASSPHPRGCSALTLAAGQLGQVVPAPAGVFRVRGVRARWFDRRPRTRGGVPPDARTPSSPRPSSPHPRGCSLGVHLDERPGLVVPAPAGVFPTTWRPRWRRPSRPRTRGGVPPGPSVGAVRVPSSPHPRGVPCADDGTSKVSDVVPAPAGVFPARRPGSRRSASRPRTRGGVPQVPSGIRGNSMSSPHPRGVPGSASSCTAVSRSSPHPRGVPPLVGGDERRGHVVPAPAGVFPSSTTTRTRPASRPRTRGGVPAAGLLIDALP